MADRSSTVGAVPSPTEKPEVKGEPGNGVERGSLKRKVKGLLLFRLVLALVFLLLTLLTQGQRAGDLLGAHLRPLYYFSVILLLFTVFAALSLERVQRLRAFAYLQLSFDVGAVTALIYLSGGVESIFAFLYMPVIISAAVLLHRRGSLVIAALCSISYGLLLDLQYFGWIAPLQVVSEGVHSRDSGTYFLTLLMSMTGFFLVAYLSGYLAEELERSGRQIRENRKSYRKLELLHRNIVESLNSGLLTITPSGSILSSNLAAQEILALPADQINGRPFRSLFPRLGEVSLSSVGFPEGSRRLSSPDRCEVSYERPSGETICLGYTISPLRNENGESSGSVFIFQDLTRVKAMEENLHRMERTVFAGRIAAEIAHEIKNPLAAISGAVQMLEMDVRGESTQSRLMSILQREIERIDELVTDFMWLAKGYQKAQSPELVPISSVVEGILGDLRTKRKLHDRHRVDTSFESSPNIWMNRNQLRQILWHLVANALEAMPEGGDLTILTRSSTAPSSTPETVIQVRDSGPGIPRDILEKIFDPFFTTKSSGTGLGLSIVYQLVESLGGRIEVEAEEPKGTTVSLFFPQQPSLPLAKRDIND